MKSFLAIKNALRKYASFSGRAPAPAFWRGLLAGFTVLILGLFLDDALGKTTRGQIGPASAVLLALIACPMLALTMRRLHDLDRTGWWSLALWGPGLLYSLPITVIPTGLGGAPGLIGGIMSLLVLYWTTRSGEMDTNRFGPPPLTCSGADL